MSVETGELAHRVQRLVDSLGGVRRCRATVEGEEIRSLVVTGEPDRDPEAMIREIRGAVLAYLGRNLSPSQVRVELPRGAGVLDAERVPRPERPLPSGRQSRSGEDRIRNDGEDGGEEDTGLDDATDEGTDEGMIGSRISGSHMDAPDRADPAGNASPERGRDREPIGGPSSRVGTGREIELREYRLVGGRGPGVEVQVLLLDRNGRTYGGSDSAESLATVRSESFIHATVRAANRLLDELDGSRVRAARSVLEVVGENDGVQVGKDRFFAVTLETWDGTGRTRATGFEAVGGKVGADVAIAATLDAIRRLMRGEGVRGPRNLPSR